MTGTDLGWSIGCGDLRLVVVRDREHWTQLLSVHHLPVPDDVPALAMTFPCFLYWSWSPDYDRWDYDMIERDDMLRVLAFLDSRRWEVAQ